MKCGWEGKWLDSYCRNRNDRYEGKEIVDKLGQLSKYDIKNEEKEGGLRIYPFEESCLKGASYDLTPTIIGMSVEFGMLEKVYRERVYPYKHYIYVKPKDTVLAVSYEYLSVPSNIAGYIVSRVSKVVEGFGHVSTSIDPNWRGSALIALNNPTNRPIKVYVGKNALGLSKPNPLATISFHYLNTKCQDGDADYHQGMRLDLLETLQYKNRQGFKAWTRRCFCRRRKKFTDFFFAYCEQISQSDILDKEKWMKFIGALSDVPLEEPKENFCAFCKNYAAVEKKGNVQVWDFVIKEGAITRLWNVVEKYWDPFRNLVLFIVVVIVMLGLLPEEWINRLKVFLDIWPCLG